MFSCGFAGVGVDTGGCCAAATEASDPAQMTASMATAARPSILTKPV